jgi:SAM-dependent methyltransferase
MERTSTRHGAADAELQTELTRIAQRYPEEVRQTELADVDRISFHARLVEGLGAQGRVVDVGGGIGTFPIACRLLGLDVTLIDVFGPAGSPWDPEGPAVALHREHGVEVVVRDIARDGIGTEPASACVVTCFETLEHLHGGVRQLCHEMVETLQAGGRLIVSVPNGVNLRKRLTVPLGRSNWASFDHWYGPETFTAHVREPVVTDLERIAGDLGLIDVQIFGRNWLGLMNDQPSWVHRATRALDRRLRHFPQLCSTLYLVGRKP